MFVFLLKFGSSIDITYHRYAFLLWKCFLPACSLPFHYPRSLLKREVLNLSVCYFVDHAFGHISKKSLPNSRPQLFSIYFLRHIILLSFTSKSIINFKLIFVYDMRYESKLIFLLLWIFSLFSTICWTNCAFSTELLLSKSVRLLLKFSCQYMCWSNSRIFYSIDPFVFMPILHCFHL